MFAEDNGVNARQILAHSKLCSRHFVAGRDYYGAAAHRRRLTVRAVPSVVSNNQDKTFDHCIKQNIVSGCTYLPHKIHSLDHYITLLYFTITILIKCELYSGGRYFTVATV